MMTVSSRTRNIFACVFGLVGALAATTALGDDVSELAKKIRELSPKVFSGEELESSRQAVAMDLRARLQMANDASRSEWRKIQSAKQWAAFRQQRLAALKHSLGKWPDPPDEARSLVARKIEGDGFVIENIVFESRPGWWVTANLYRPAKPGRAMPGIIVSHSHHRPKEHGELQDMGMTWARAGCYVLVPDHLGHGERGQHGFTSADDFPREFRVSRQDYYFRYDNSIQLYLTGESLMGWMAWDLMRGVDVLLAQEGIDSEKIILLGAVAGGGDPCAVTAALDERITCAVPFNFGGPQPETRYPLPEDAETWFNYAGSGSWESTRNLAFSAGRDSRFLPWEIVGSIAPRRLIFGHEFSWHRERDPVWKRLQRIYELENATGHLAFTHGRGELKGRPPEATHCTHIGKFHRQKIHEALAAWFGIEAEEYSDNRDSTELHVLSTKALPDVQTRNLHTLLTESVAEQLSRRRKEYEQLAATKWREQLRTDLARLLGDVSPVARPTVIVRREKEVLEAGDLRARVHRIYLKQRCELGKCQVPFVPLLLLMPEKTDDQRRPLVVAISQAGKAKFIDRRSADIAKLMAAGIAVCLPDSRNTGELIGDHSRGRYSSATSRAATALMVGDPVVAQQLRDLRSTIGYMRERDDIDAHKIALWGESFAPLNLEHADFRVPRRIDSRPHDVEPLGGLLALLTALYEDDVSAVYIHRGLAEFQDVLQSPFVYAPLDSVIPGLLDHADIPDLAAVIAPRPLCFSGTVDAFNRPLSESKARKAFQRVKSTYQRAKSDDRLTIAEKVSPSDWLIRQTAP